MFRYQGEERLQLWFVSPNECGVFLAVTVLVSIGIFCGCLLIKKRYIRYTSLTLTILLILFQQLLLAGTYSRGGYLGAFAGLFFAWLLCRKKAVLIFLLTGIFITFSIAKGGSRVGSIVRVSSDASIANRILLWRGASGIIAQNPVSGVSDAGGLYHAWYQPLWLDEHYGGMISDPMGITVQYGVWAGMLFFAIFLLPLYFSWRYIRLWGDYGGLFAGFAGALAGYLVSSFFSTFYMVNLICWTMIVLLTIVALALLILLIRKKVMPKWWDFAIPIAGALLMGSGIFLWGCVENARLPYSWSYRELPWQERHKSWECHAVPKSDIKGTVICMLSEKWTQDNYYGDFIREFGRALLNNGYELLVAAPREGRTGKKDAVEYLREAIAVRPERKIYLFGVGRQSQTAILAAAEVNAVNIAGVAAVNSPARWPFEELSPIEFINRISAPVILFASSGNMPDAMELAELRNKANLPVKTVEITMDDRENILPELEDWLDEKMD